MISILCVTRERPKKVKRLIKSIEQTTGNLNNIELLFYFDDDDQKSIAIKDEIEKKHFIRVFVDKRDEYISNSWNYLWKKAMGDILFLAADDLVFETKNWEIKMINEFNKFKDGIAYGHANDGIKGGPTHPFVTKKWTEVVGYFCPPDFNYCNDSWLYRLALKIKERMFARMDVMIRHKHWTRNKNEKDKIAAEILQRGSNHKDKQRMINGDKQREEDAQKLRKYIKEFEK